MESVKNAILTMIRIGCIVMGFFPFIYLSIPEDLRLTPALPYAVAQSPSKPTERHRPSKETKMDSEQLSPDMKEKLERIRKKLKRLDSTILIYMDSRGNIAGVGDPSEVVGTAEKLGMALHPTALEMGDLPKDRFGLIDWAAAIKTGKVHPIVSLDEAGKGEQPMPTPLDPGSDEIEIATKSEDMPNVIFSHSVHKMWLNCNNCHPSIFTMKAGGHPEMTMPKISSGQYCGRCHNRVAFPLFDCLRCHVKEKGTKRKVIKE